MSRKLVLCPLDFSEGSREALRYAAAIAEHLDWDLLLSAVDDPLLNDAVNMTAGDGELARETTGELERFYHGTFADRLVPVSRPRFASAIGAPAVEILALADRSHADLIVMSARGSSTVRKMFFGSTTERVLRETTLPVLVTPSEGRGQGPLGDLRQGLRHVLVTVDLSGASARQATAADAIAASLGVPLIALHVVEPIRANRPGLRALPSVEGERRDRAERGLASMAATLRGAPRVEPLVVYGEPSEEVAKVAHDRDAGLIVMGLHASPLRGPRLGSVTYRVLCLAHVPVLALPPPDAGETIKKETIDDYSHRRPDPHGVLASGTAAAYR
jgi:nucleotide-binding universal stress UspA family protein